MTNLQYITETFQNEEYLKRKAKQIINTNTTNDWGFDGIQSVKYLMSNGSSYEDKRIDKYSKGGGSEHLYIFKIGKKVVSKEEWLKFNKIKRETSIKLWKHPVYKGSYDELIKDYIEYKI